ncbi:MAG: phosphatidylglycerol---prolipoprotein diacylglyceryl transferase, partial [Actinomycetota bacterium]
GPVLAVAGLPFGAFWDAAAVTMLVGLVLTRVGCFMNGCCVGRPTAGWLGLPSPDVHGTIKRRIPTQLLEAAWGVAVLMVVLATLSAQWPAGARGAAVVASYSAFRIVSQGWRE